MQGLLDQEAANAGAVEEEVAGDGLAALHHHRLDKTVLAAQAHIDDLAFDAAHAAPLAQAPQIARIERRVEVIGVGDLPSGDSVMSARARMNLLRREATALMAK